MGGDVHRGGRRRSCDGRGGLAGFGRKHGGYEEENGEN